MWYTKDRTLDKILHGHATREASQIY